jgi:hypothetical protein
MAIRNLKTEIYFGSLFFLLSFASPIGGLSSIAVQYLLKDDLNAGPFEMSLFGFWAGLPLYFGFCLGIFRDLVRFHYLREPAYVVVGALIAAGSYLYLATTTPTFGSLSIASLGVVLGLTIVATAGQALMVIVARERSTAGRFSAIWNIGAWAPAVVAFPLGGWLAPRISRSTMFELGLAVSAAIALYGFLMPRSLSQVGLQKRDANDNLRTSLGRLMTHRPLWLALAIIFLFSFSPGWQTPLFYHLTQSIKISSDEYGLFLAILAAFQIPGVIVFWIASSRTSLRTTLWWGTALMILQAPLPLLMQDSLSTQVIGALAALLFGVGSGAYWALLIRACLTGLEGSGYMLGFAVANIAGKAGDVAGSWLYEMSGFVFAMIINTATTAMIIPIILALPAKLLMAKDASA